MKLLDAPVCNPFFAGEKPVVAMELSNGGHVRIELDPSAAPITVSYFLTLVLNNFYNGTTFHRIVPGFLIQGGDPTGTGDGETDSYVKGEFTANGVDNPLTHVEGTISLARQEGYDSASCQFFIMLCEVPFMDGEYAAFGRVIEGMDAIMQIADAELDENDNPVSPVAMTRVYLEM